MHREEYKNMCKTNQWIVSLKFSKSIKKKVKFFFCYFTYIDA